MPRSREEAVRAPGSTPSRITALRIVLRRSREPGVHDAPERLRRPRSTGGRRQALQPHDDRRHLRVGARTPMGGTRRTSSPRRPIRDADAHRSVVLVARPGDEPLADLALHEHHERVDRRRVVEHRHHDRDRDVVGKVRAQDPRAVARARPPSRASSRRRATTRTCRGRAADLPRAPACSARSNSIARDVGAGGGERERQRPRGPPRPRPRDRRARCLRRPRSLARGWDRSGNAGRAPWRDGCRGGPRAPGRSGPGRARPRALPGEADVDDAACRAGRGPRTPRARGR